MPTHVLESETFLCSPLSHVFDFFSRAENLQKLTPPSLGFQILTALPIEMKQGALIDYKIRISGVPLKWRTEISHWDPPRSFTDTQLSGPYKKWVHTHRFEEADGGVRMTDVIEYEIIGWIFEPVIHKLFVRPRVEQIFTYRNKVVHALLGTNFENPSLEPSDPKAV